MDKGLKLFEKYMKAQKDLAESWQEMTREGIELVTQNMEEGNYFFNPEDYFKKAAEWTMKTYSAYKAEPQELYTKMNEAQAAYRNLFNVWSKINEEGFQPTLEASQKMYDEWFAGYTEQMRTSYLSYMPEPVKKIVDDSLSLLESYRTATTKYWEPWIEDKDKLNEAFIKGMTSDPKAYLEYLQIWKDSYEKSLSKLVNIPTMGFNRELLEKQSDNFDKFVRFSTLVNEITAHIYKIGQETMQKVVEDYLKLREEGKDIKSFEEFYKFWGKEIGDALDTLYFSKDFSELIGQALKAMTELKIESDKLWEAYLSYYPIPKNSDMDSLYKTVNDLKKEVRSLKKEISALKTPVAEAKPVAKEDKTKA